MAAAAAEVDADDTEETLEVEAPDTELVEVVVVRTSGGPLAGVIPASVAQWLS